MYKFLILAMLINNTYAVNQTSYLKYTSRADVTPLTSVVNKPSVCAGCFFMKKVSIINQPELYILVDDEDFERINSYRWRLNKRQHTNYAVRSVLKNDQRGLNYPSGVYVHREITNVILDKSVQVDHWDGDGLNNQKYNLRICTPTKNQGNRKKVAKFSSKHKGVYFHESREKWVASLRTGSKKGKRFLGYFDEEKDAALAYNNAATEYFGEFAKLNIV